MADVKEEVKTEVPVGKRKRPNKVIILIFNLDLII